jgi:hypothetical protein
MSQTITTKPEHLESVAPARGEAVQPISNYWKALAPIIVGVALLLVPVPAGLTANAWYYFALFVAVIIALILEPIPAAAVGLIGVTAATVSQLVLPKPGNAIAAFLLHPGPDGDHFSLCHRPRSDLLWQRLCQPERFLDARPDLWDDLSNRPAGHRCPLSPLLLGLV